MAHCLVHTLLGAFAKLRKGTIIIRHVCPSVPSSWSNSDPNGRIFNKSVDRVQVSFISNKNKVYFTWRLIYISYHILLISSYNKKCCRIKVVEKIKTQIFYSATFFFLRKSCSLWDNVENYCGTGQTTDMAIWRMRIACWIPKAKNTHIQVL